MSGPGIESRLAAVAPRPRRILESCLEGRELGWREACELSRARGAAALRALCAAADRLRAEQAGDDVAYVVNRNINFTNVCVKSCGFCAFSRTRRSEEGYFLGEEEVVRRAVQARDMGATEVCIQAGLPPGMDGRLYVRLCAAVKRAAPELHVHAFSPEEVKYGAGLCGIPIRAYLEELRAAGLGSLPGTSAEILDDAVRARVSGGRITTAEWLEVIRSAHALGIPTTATIMYGHVETDEQRMRHLDLLRAVQRETGGFTEIVPLSFVREEAPMARERRMAGLRSGLAARERVRFTAIARLMLGATFRNVQASWVKEGMGLATLLLGCGANDLGGTLMNESISTSAGAQHGQLRRPAELRAAIRGVGRVPVQRDTFYHAVRRFDATADGPGDLLPLDAVGEPDRVFGSYEALTRDERFRFRPQTRL